MDGYFFGYDTYYTSIPVWTDPSGTSHTFDTSWSWTHSDCTPSSYDQTVSGYATDGSGYSIQLSGASDSYPTTTVVRDNNGTQVYPQAIDRYGNFFSSDANGNLIDHLGRTPVIVTTNGNVTYYDVLSPNGPINNNGTRVRYTVTTAPIGVNTYFHQPLSPGSSNYVGEWNGTLYPIQSIQLPDGSAYTFTYDKTITGVDTSAHYGEITSVTLPTGAVIHYNYEVFQDSFGNLNRWASERQVGSDPSTTFVHNVTSWCASGATGCKEKTTIHRPSGDETVYEQTLNNGAWNSNVTAYTASAASGQQLFNTVSTYDFSHPCSSAICTGAQYITKSYATTTLSNGLQSQAQYVYNDPQLGKVNAVKEWDYFTGSPSGTPTRETDYSYTGLDLHQVTILDSTGNMAGQITYGYTTSATATSNVTGHGTTNAGGPYLQTVTHWLNTGASPSTTYTMDDTGMVTNVVDPKLNPATTFSYQCANALPRDVTPLGQSNRTTRYGYDCNSGELTSVQDPNDLAANRAGTTYNYEAVAGRPYTVTPPDGGQTTYTYPSATEVDTSVTATPNPTISSQDILDSLGRTYQHIQGGNSTETTYDTSGRVNCVTNPHVATSPASTSTCITLYDGLGRPKTQVQPDGSTLVSSYNGNVTTTSDEVGNSWQRTSNVFGKLTSVMEPGNHTTAYSYDALGNLSTITQNGGLGESTRPRSFNFDSLSRLIKSTTPEAGTICYGVWGGANCINGYDANGNVLVKTDARGVATTFSYDALNRLTYKHYSDGTLAAAFGYDGNTENGTPLSQFGIQSNNAIGRLSLESNQVNAAQAYSYDSLGRIILQNQVTPSVSNWGTTFSLSYDLVGNMTSFTYPDGRKVSQDFDSAGRMSSVNYASWNGNTKSYSYLGTTSYDPTGHLIGASMGNGIGLSAGYDNRGRVGQLSYGTPTQFQWGKVYKWTPNNNLQATTDLWTGVQRQFTYDNLNRVMSAQDIVGSFPGAPWLPPGSSSTGSTSGATPVPEWTNPDDSNVLVNPDAPGTSGWSFDTNVTYQPGVIAPDGTPSATNLIAAAGASDAYAQNAVENPSRFSGETMTGSVWLRSPSGSHTVSLYIIEYLPGASQTQIASWKTVTVTSGWQQFHISAQTVPNLQGLWLMVGGAGTIANGQTISIWNPMMEDSGTSGATVTNFLPYSQRFTASTWVSTTTSIAENSAPAPDGSSTAATIAATNATDSYVIDFVANPAPFSGLPMTGSVWLRSPSGPKNLYITMIDIGSDGFQTVGATVAALTTDWQRFQISGTNHNTLSQLALAIGGAATFQTGATIQAWGAQMELASTAGPYVATGGIGASSGTSLTNLLPYSQQLSGPSWDRPGTTIVSNAVVAPDGTGTGNHVTVLPGYNDAWVTDDVTHPALYNGAIVAGSIFLRTSDAPHSISLSVAGENASGRTYLGMVTVPLTSTWHRFTLTGQLPNGLNRVFLQVGGSGSFSSGQSVDLWGAQLEMAPSAGPYVATSGLPVVAGQELTNILPSSQQLNGPGWGQQHGSITVNTATAPDGTITAATLTADPSADDAYAVNMVPNPSLYDEQTVTASVYLRVPSGTLNVMMYLNNIGDQSWNIQASNLVTLTTDWQRFSVTGTNQNGLSDLYLQIGGASTIHTGQSIQIWGAQMTVGSSAAPYTPTPSTGTIINVVTGQPGTLVTTGLNQAYSYDSFGNIQQNGSFNSTYTAKNQMFGYAYDAAGNLLSDGLNVMSWDGENRLASVGGATYLYDAEGNRVEKEGVGVTDTIYFGGRPIARLSAGQWTDLIYGPTGMLAEVPGTENGLPIYRVTDHLGSTVGTLLPDGTFTNPLDYAPFGRVFSGSTSDPYTFTGLEHDSESGLDHTQFRQLSSSQGRWLSPDPYDGSMDLSNPQSFNRYSYVGNMPLGFTDPSGLLTCGNCSTGAGNGSSAGGLAGVLGAGGIGFLIDEISSIFSHPQCYSCDHPRPNGNIWDEHGSYKPKPYTSAADILGIAQAGCEFGACGGGFLNQTQINENKTLQQKIDELAAAGVFVGPLETKYSPFHKWFCSQHVASIREAEAVVSLSRVNIITI